MSAVEDRRDTLLAHLNELRSRLLRAVIVVVVVFAAFAPFAHRLFSFVAQPLLERLPEGTSMIATQVTTPFLAPFKLAFITAIFTAMPYLLFQVWAFIAPGLYKQEKRLFAPLLITSIFLFYAGIAFAYYVVFPIFFLFMTGIVPEGVVMATDIGEYLDFVLTLFFAFGVAFEVPVAIVLLVWAGFITPAALAGKRSYVLLGFFVIGMFITPPDIFSQTLVALPMYALYEIGIVMSRVFVRGWREVEAQKRDARERDGA